jgi:wyosine [tRNA(Phe)-imidazoG37] synthetase (radical SAM superfamily)
LILEGGPEYVEIKAYAHMGQSINRLPFSKVPGFEQVRAAAEELAGKTDYLLSASQERGGAVLLCRDKKCEQDRFFA